jgi:RNA polymerase sigma-70 factor (ECF subfamily)
VEGRPPGDRHGFTRDEFARLVRSHEGIARRVALVICGSAVEADDAVEEAIVKAWYALGRFRPGSEFRPWLLAIVANEARNRRRAAGRRAAYELRAASEARAVGDRGSGEAAPSAESAVLDAERRQAVLDAVAALPEPQREVVACRYLLGLSEAETASALGLRAGTAKSRLSRGMATLRVTLDGIAP